MGVIIGNELKFPAHLAKKMNKANMVVRSISRFSTLDQIIFKSFAILMQTTPGIPKSGMVFTKEKQCDGNRGSAEGGYKTDADNTEHPV